MNSLDKLKLSARDRGLDISDMYDENIAMAMHQEADRLGIPQSLKGYKYKGKLVRQLAEAFASGMAITIDEAAASLNNEFSILPMKILEVLNCPYHNKEFSEAYYAQIDDMEMYLRYPQEATASNMKMLDSINYPDSDIVTDMTDDGVDTATFINRIATESTPMLEILNQCGPMTYVETSYVPLSIVYYSDTEDYSQQLDSQMYPTPIEKAMSDSQIRKEMKQQDLEYAKACEMDRKARKAREEDALKILDTLPTLAESSAFRHQPRATETGPLVSRLYLPNGNIVTLRYTYEEPMSGVLGQLQNILNTDHRIAFNAVFCFPDDQAGSFLGDRKSFNLEVEK